MLSEARQGIAALVPRRSFMFTIIMGSEGTMGGFFFFSLWRFVGLVGWEEVVVGAVLVAAVVFCGEVCLGASAAAGCDPAFAATGAGALGSGTLFASVCGSR